MLKFFKKAKGQSTLEAVILIIIVIGALLSIQVYIKRGLQGRLKSAADDIGDQYSDSNTNVLKTVTVKSNTQETNLAGKVISKMLTKETTVTNITSNIITYNSEYWGN